MRLLILTQKVDINDDILGFFHSWLIKFAEKCEKVVVICLEKGDYNLPANVKILSLGKERGARRITYLFNFYKHLWQERKNYDTVFSHMNPIYVVLGGLFWRLSDKKIILWYTHRQVDLRLRIAEKFANVILTASQESFCLKSDKVKISGHGIDTEKFVPVVERQNNEKFTIIYVGRISRIKNQELLVEAVDYLVNFKGVKDIKIEFIGSPVYPEDKKYFDYLQKLINDKSLSGYVSFTGSVPYREIIDVYHQADLSVNLCPTGGLDKAVLESMSCGLPVIIFNKSFGGILDGFQDELILENLAREELARKILAVKNWDLEKRKTAGRALRELVEQKHNLNNLIDKIISSCQ